MISHWKKPQLSDAFFRKQNLVVRRMFRWVSNLEKYDTSAPIVLRWMTDVLSLIIEFGSFSKMIFNILFDSIIL